MFELSNGFCMGGVSKGKINLVELSNVRVNGQSSYRMLTVLLIVYVIQRKRGCNFKRTLHSLNVKLVRFEATNMFN